MCKNEADFIGEETEPVAIDCTDSIVNIKYIIIMNWEYFIKLEAGKDYYKELEKKLENNGLNIFPEKQNIFNAFKYCPYENTKVVLLGQDPYHGVNQANGLCFSVQYDQKFPPSLKNIFKELQNDIGTIKQSGDLTQWAKQGVLMLNSVLTVNEGSPNSHKGWGWEIFTDNVIKYLNKNKESIVFVLWGKYAQKKGEIIDTRKHKVIKCSHPSPLSANKGGFFGTKPFSTCNSYLNSPIQW